MLYGSLIMLYGSLIMLYGSLIMLYGSLIMLYSQLIAIEQNQSSPQLKYEYALKYEFALPKLTPFIIIEASFEAGGP